MSKKKEIELELQEAVVEEPAVVEEQVSKEDADLRDEAAEMKEQARKTIQKIKEQAKEEDPKLTPTLTLRTILGGDFLTADMVRRQIWLFMLMVVFTRGTRRQIQGTLVFQHTDGEMSRESCA